MSRRAGSGGAPPSLGYSPRWSPTLLCLVVGGGLALRPPAAHACGVGGDSGSDSSSDSGSSSGSSDDSSYDDSGSSEGSSSTPACVEDSPVVGRSPCRRFGAWRANKVPALKFAFGTSAHRFSLESLSFAGSAAHDRDRSYRMVGEEFARDRAARGLTFDLRASLPLGRHAYLALASSVGGVSLASEVAVEVGDGQRVRTAGGFMVEGGTAFGVAAPLGDRYRMRAEVAVAMRMISLAAVSTHLDCVVQTGASATSLTVTPSVAVERWLSPFWSASLSVGSNVLERGDLAVGFALTGYLRAFDRSLSR